MSTDRRKNLRDMLDEIDRYFEDFEKEIQDMVREGIEAPKGQGKPFVAGFSLKLGPEGIPSIQVFGDTPMRDDGSRTPLTEQVVDEKNGTLRLIADMPGVDKGDIKVDATEEKAVIAAERGNRRYKAEVILKAQVQADTGKAEFKNGVLEISFSLRDKANKGYRRVDIV